MLNKNVVPLELVVGVKKELCYITYYKNKNKTKLNSETSWEQWRDKKIEPIVIENKFMNGFKFSGVNRRYSSQATNSANVMIEHPLLNKSFEIPLNELYRLIKQCVVRNGVLDLELIMDNTRNLLTKDDYYKAVEDFEKQKEIKKQQAKKIDKSKVIKNNDLIKGKLYQSVSDNTFLVYLGKVKTGYIKDGQVVKNCFMRISNSEVNNIQSRYTDKYYYIQKKGDVYKKPQDFNTTKLNLPFIIRYEETQERFYSNIKTIKHKVKEGVFVRKNNIRLKNIENIDVNIFDGLTDIEIKYIEEIYNKANYNTWYGYWHRDSECVCEIDWFK